MYRAQRLAHSRQETAAVAASAQALEHTALSATVTELRRGGVPVAGPGSLVRYVATLATQVTSAAATPTAVAASVITPANTTILTVPLINMPTSVTGSRTLLRAAAAAIASHARLIKIEPVRPFVRHTGAAPRGARTPRFVLPAAPLPATVAATTYPAPARSATTTATQPRRAPVAQHTSPARTTHPSAASAPSAATQTIRTVFYPVERVLTSVPWWVYLALSIAMSSAGASATLAVRNGRRARRQAFEIVAASTAAIQDPLTGLLNRRGFEDALTRELARSRRHGRQFVIAYADVRGLKTVNDNLGHAAGDTLLKNVATLLTSCARAGDTVARLGGDEFALLLAEHTAEDGAAVTTRIAHAVTTTQTTLALPHPWDLTVGTAAYPTDGHDAATLLDLADRRLYEQRGIALAATR